MDPARAGKLTGMLLELEDVEILELLWPAEPLAGSWVEEGIDRFCKLRVGIGGEGEGARVVRGDTLVECELAPCVGDLPY